MVIGGQWWVYLIEGQQFKSIGQRVHGVSNNAWEFKKKKGFKKSKNSNYF